MPPKRFPTKTTTKPRATSSNNQPNTPAQPRDEKYEKELAWCVRQLELGLQRPDVAKEQEQESRSVIAKLKSTSLSKVEKRHLMHVVFGDYRKIMQQQENEQNENKEDQSLVSSGVQQDQQSVIDDNKHQ